MLYCVSAIMTSNHNPFPPNSDQRITDETAPNIFYCLFLLHDIGLLPLPNKQMKILIFAHISYSSFLN